MNLQQLRCVVAIVEHRTFTNAARVLHMSQPALSYAVTSLEKELGTPLFERIGRRVALTAAGEAVLVPARQALREADTVRSAVAGSAGVVTGRLDLVSMQTLTTPVAGLVGRFRRRYPDTTVMLHNPEDDEAAIDLVRSGRFELGLTRTRTRSTDLESAPFMTEEFVAIFPPGTRAGRRGVVQLEELSDHEMVAPPRGTPSRAEFDGPFRARQSSPNVAVETGSLQSILELVRCGAGASVVPRHAAKRVSGLVIRRFTPTVVREVRFVRRRGPCSPVADAFMRLASTPVRRPGSRSRRARPGN